MEINPRYALAIEAVSELLSKLRISGSSLAVCARGMAGRAVGRLDRRRADAAQRKIRSR